MKKKKNKTLIPDLPELKDKLEKDPKPLTEKEKMHTEEFEEITKEMNKEEKQMAKGKIEEPIIEEQEKDISKYFYLAVGLILLILVFLFLLPKIFDTTPKTLDELHQENLLEGKDTDTAYVYNGFSFIYLDGLWYTQIQNKHSNILYDVPLHYGPKEVSDIPLIGDPEPFFTLIANNSIANYEFQTYLTFDPTGDQLQYVGLGTGELTQNMATIYSLAFIPACTNNNNESCQDTPIITCESTEDPVIFINVDDVPSVEAEGNCLTIQGKGYDIVKAVDRLLLSSFGIIK